MARVIQFIGCSGIYLFFYMLLLLIPFIAIVFKPLLNMLSRDAAAVAMYISNAILAAIPTYYYLKRAGLIRLFRWKREVGLKIASILAVLGHLGTVAFYIDSSQHSSVDGRNYFFLFLLVVVMYSGVMILGSKGWSKDHLNSSE